MSTRSAKLSQKERALKGALTKEFQDRRNVLVRRYAKKGLRQRAIAEVVGLKQPAVSKILSNGSKEKE